MLVIRKTQGLRDVTMSTLAVVLSTMCLGVGTALAQVTGTEPENRTSTIQADEEILVVGQSLAELRKQLILAQDAVFAKFNEINSDDDFDIICREEAPTGSRIRKRVCLPNFWRDAQAEVGSEQVRELQGGITFPGAAIYGEAQRRDKVMTEEMYRLMIENAEFRETLVRLGDLVLAAQGSRVEAKSSAILVTSDMLSDTVLPLGATLFAQVQIGQKAWRHDLTQYSFSISRLAGEIAEIAVRCRGIEETLDYVAGSEWSLPDDWRRCSLRIDATPGTRFRFYEFE